jgi:hypothetical protein
VIGLAQSAQSATFTNTTIDFSESVFPDSPAAITGTQSYNLLNDQTGTKLTVNNGDASDIAITFANSGVGALSTIPKLAIDGTKIVSTRGYKDMPKVSLNNPGTLISTTATLKFLPQWNVTNLQAEFSSLNSAGILWEYSVLGFLKPDGTPFSAAPSIGSYNNTSGFTGSPTIGWYVAADKDTVLDVGTAETKAKTGSGADGTSDTLKLTYALAGLNPNTPVGGLIWTTYLEDTRGTGNKGSEFTASLAGLTFSGSTQSANAVPTPALLPGLIALTAGARRRWKAAQ